MAKGAINLQKESGGVTKITSTDGVGVTEVTVPESGNLVSVDTAVTDNAIARYDGTTGKLQNSGVTIDDAGNVGVGINPSAWTIGNSIDIAYNCAIFGDGKNYSWDCGIVHNGYQASANQWNYKSTINQTASMYRIHGNRHEWRAAPSGTAGNPITWTQQMRLDDSGNLLLTSGTGALGYGAGAGGIVTQLTSKSTAVTLNKPSGRITMNNAALGAGATVEFILYNALMRPFDTMTLSIPNLIPYDIFNYKVTYNLYNGGALIFVTNVSGSILSEAISINFNLHKGANYNE